MDLAPFVAWIPVLIGSAVAWRYGTRLKAVGVLRTFFKSCAFSLGIGLGLTFVGCVLNNVCIGIGMCIYRGDANIGYWFHSFFAIPLFLGITLTAFVSKK